MCVSERGARRCSRFGVRRGYQPCSAACARGVRESRNGSEPRKRRSNGETSADRVRGRKEARATGPGDAASGQGNATVQERERGAKEKAEGGGGRGKREERARSRGALGIWNRKNVQMHVGVRGCLTHALAHAMPSPSPLPMPHPSNLVLK